MYGGYIFALCALPHHFQIPALKSAYGQAKVKDILKIEINKLGMINIRKFWQVFENGGVMYKG